MFESRWLGCALLSAAGVILMSCSQQPSGAEPVQAAPPPLDDGIAGAQQQVDRFASRHGALGQYYDENSGSFVLVFPADAEAPPPDRIATELQVPVRIHPVEMTQEIFDSIQTDAARLHSARPDSTYAIYLDLATGKARLTSDLPLHEVQPLLKKYPNLLETDAGSIHTDVTELRPR